ncbi:hypothetical protein GOP47_0008271 [Adiantum capillus-veneris]|uniref:Uncharacterized protein n=1 Tax=Adiantum capillus-veneris TaxID=13818 RepID=A0A9D4UYH3_ADICA|nr:hypothetical protein GOP47_0008271 [Adiantum capillus-veneris]
MISGWSSLQLPLGPESHGRGAFTPPPPSMASRPSSREQSFRSYDDRGGLDSFSFPELKVTLVENLIGALINATEILDGYTPSPGVHAAVKHLLGFEASNQDRDLALASHLLPQSEPLEILFHERLISGSSVQSSISASLDNMASTQLRSQGHTHADPAVWSSFALHGGGLSQGRWKFSANTIHSGGSHGNVHSPSSEEDLLLQEARSKAFRSRMEPDEMKDIRRAEISGDGLVDVALSDSKQATNVSYGLTKKSGVCAETERAWSLAEILRPSQQNSLFWGSIALGMLLIGAVIVTCQSSFFKGRQLQRPSVKRRILKSQWYGSPASPAWEHKNFQMKISEFPKYPLLEVDGDRKLLRFPSGSAGVSAAFVKRENQPIIRAQTPQKQPIWQSIQDMRIGHVPSPNKAGGGQPIRQTIHSSSPLLRKQHGSMKAQQEQILNGGASAEGLPEDKNETVVSQPKGSGFHGARVRRSIVQDEMPNPSFSRINTSKSRIDQGQWGKEDEIDLDRRIEKLYQTIQAVEQHRRSAMLALEEERQRSLALEQEMSKQREAAAVLGEEVRLLKESHNALLTSLQKKYSTSAAARTAADLVYQDWERRVAAELLAEGGYLNEGIEVCGCQGFILVLHHYRLGQD